MPIGENQGQISQDIADKFVEAQPDADVSSGSVHRDLIDITASQIAEAYAELEEARLAASLKNAAAADEDGLSAFALNYDVLRQAATKGTGTVTFQSSSRPSANISIPAGTVVRTLPMPDGSYVEYVTTEAVVLATTASQNLLTGLWEVDADVEAVLAGTAYAVGVNALVSLPNRIAGITSVTNKEAISSAEDGDDNEDLAASVLEKTAGSDIGTPGGYEAMLLAEFEDEISAVAVVGPRNSENTRVQYGNEVDIPVVSTDAASFTSILQTNGSAETRFGDVRPVLSVATVVGTTNGTHYSRNVHWGFKRDTGPVYGYSAQSFDALCWFPGQQPGPGLRLTVQGTYDSVVARAQDFLDDPQVAYITGGLLVKTAQEVAVDISVSVLADSGVDREQLATDIETAITEALEGYTLGEDVLEDDIVDVINGVAGVSSVSIPFTDLSRAGGGTGNSVSVTDYEYARAGTLTITVS